MTEQNLIGNLRTLAKNYGRADMDVDVALMKAADTIEKLLADNAVMLLAVNAFCDLMDSSNGVAGLHLNGDIAPWDELRSGGRFEEWLKAIDDITPGAHPGSTLLAQVAKLRECGQELVALMEAVREGEYKPDSFTTQPMREALATGKESE